MRLDSLNNIVPAAIILYQPSQYRAEFEFRIQEEINTSSASPLEMIRDQICDEIQGIRNLRKDLKKQHPELLAHVKE